MQTQHESTRRAAVLLDNIAKHAPTAQGLIDSLRTELNRLDCDITELETTQSRHLSMISAEAVSTELPYCYRICCFTPREQVVMEFLYKFRGRDFIQRETLMGWLYSNRVGKEAPFEKILDVFMCKMRKKMRQHEEFLRAQNEPCRIETVWGRGMRLSDGAAMPVCNQMQRFKTAA